MTDTYVSQGDVLGVGEFGNINPWVSLGTVFAAANFPAEFSEASQIAVVTAGPSKLTAELSEATVFGLARGRIENRRVRAWPDTLDGHDMYFIRLGETATLMYDLTTGQWSQWASPGMAAWRPNYGLNWLGLGKVAYDDGHTSNALLGDDTYGLLWTMDPTSGLDQSPRADLPDRSYTRRVVGGVPMRLRETQKVGAAYVTASIGEPSPLLGANIALRTSDDNGKTWLDHGTVVATSGTWDQEFVWRSLGLIKAPGRIFEITDDGATVRIDALDIR
jgi:hypothetical protein